MKVTLSATFVNTLEQWPISVTVLLNNTVVWRKSVLISEDLLLEINDTVASNKIKIMFDGKTNVDTDTAADTAIIISKIQIQNIDVESVLQRIAKYSHNTNGATELITTEYTNFVGFDGCIEFNLDTPIANWFYKNYSW